MESIEPRLTPSLIGNQCLTKINAMEESIEHLDASIEKLHYDLKISLDDTQKLRMQLEKFEAELGQKINDLTTSNQDIKSTNERLAASNQDIKSTNERLAASNQDLKSTNERLAASNQDPKSNNERLAASNQDLIQKVNGLEEGLNDLKSKNQKSEKEIKSNNQKLENEINELTTKYQQTIEKLEESIKMNEIKKKKERAKHKKEKDRNSSLQAEINTLKSEINKSKKTRDREIKEIFKKCMKKEQNSQSSLIYKLSIRKSIFELSQMLRQHLSNVYHEEFETMEDAYNYIYNHHYTKSDLDNQIEAFLQNYKISLTQFQMLKSTKKAINRRVRNTDLFTYTKMLKSKLKDEDEENRESYNDLKTFWQSKKDEEEQRNAGL